MDAKEILGLAKNTLPISKEKKSRPPKEPQRKHDRVSRELYMLTGGMAPLMTSIDTAELEKRPPSDEKLLYAFSVVESINQLLAQTEALYRASSPADVSGHPFMKEPYNAKQEVERKRALSMFLSVTKQQDRKDAEL